ncbi:DUF7550 family protein [Natronorubrum thiooxidans]|uniref:Uncharacterized protein n=1 Tax=Natronorubrum thiooxidans TaxID=308853 RepID=A0A1N7E6G5_9EURY|nr:hypothetical protein [Natronorubrum thiooxidans]SIR83667.1 hypothetical protein SAMN05421752_103249 [Natronorubrum thiooxidans]
MTADTDQTAAQDSAERTTAPMSDYSSSAVGIGFVVTAIGVAIAFGIPLLTIAL